MASRAAQVREACVSAIAAAWQPTGDDAVNGVWAADIGLDPDRPAELLNGRQVFVFASALSQPSVLTRNSTVRRYAVSVLICERYTTEAGPVPSDWIDERVEFVESTVFGVLADPGISLLGGAVRLDMEAEHAIDVLADRDLIQKTRSFWSVASFTFKEVV